MFARVTRDGEVTLQMYADDRVPLLFAAREHHAIADEPGVVDEHVETAERVDRGLHKSPCALPIGDVVGVRGCLTAGGTDIVDDRLRGADAGAGAVERGAEIVDDDARGFTRKRKRMFASDAASRTGDDDDAAFTDPAHGPYPTFGEFSRRLDGFVRWHPSAAEGTFREVASNWGQAAALVRSRADARDGQSAGRSRSPWLRLSSFRTLRGTRSTR